jgi:glutathione S-transferase
LIQLFDSSFKNYLDRYKYSNRYENEDPIGNRDLAIQILDTIEGQINNHNLLYGDRFSFVDMAILPFIRQFRIADTDWFDNDMALPKIQQWLNKFLNSDLYLAVMNKYKVWENNAPVVYFPK